MRLFIRILAVLMALLMVSPPSYAALYANTVVFGGRGEDGDVTKAGTETTPLIVNARKFVVSGTWSPKSGTVVNSSHDVSITGTVNVATNLQTVALVPAQDTGVTFRGAGIGAGQCNQTYGGNYTGGSGAGFGGKGGDGGTSSSSTYRTLGGNTYTPDAMPMGSSGGNGYYNPSSGTGSPGVGGPGGGSIRFYCAGNLTISGSGVVHVDGGAGTAAGTGGSGAGGGSGGYGLFAALKSIAVTATNGVTAKGGAGGGGVSGTGNGAGGGGGYLTFISPSITLTGGTDLTGGAAGSGGTTVIAATAGASGVSLQIQAVPTLQIIAAVDTKQKVCDLLAFCGMNSIELTEINEAVVFDFVSYQNQRQRIKGLISRSEADKILRVGGQREVA